MGRVVGRYRLSLRATADLLPSRPTPPTLNRWQRAAIGVGNGLEFYDFSISGFFAVPIGRVFFPASNPWTSLLLSVASFGVGYLARPLGALAIGTFADRRGRKPAMLATVLLIAVGTAGIAVLPGYDTLGVMAPVLLIALRLLQGFALGRETGPAVAFLVEAAEPGRKGQAVVWQVATNGAALFAAGAVGLMLSAILAPPLLDAWGWRFAMLLGLAVVPLGLAIRASLPHTEPSPRCSRIADERSAGARAGDLLAATLVIASGTVPFSIGGFMTSYGIAALHLGSNVAFFAAVLLGVATVATAPLGGWLADHVGQRRAVVISRLAIAASACPAFAWMAGSEGATSLLIVSFGLAAMSTIGTPSALCLIVEAMPPRSRAAGLSVVYALGISLFGGATQPAATALLRFTGDHRSPAWLLVGAGLIGAAAALAMSRREAPRTFGTD